MLRPLVPFRPKMRAVFLTVFTVSGVSLLYGASQPVDVSVKLEQVLPLSCDALWERLDWGSQAEWRPDLDQIKAIPSSAGIDSWLELHRGGGMTVVDVEILRPGRLKRVSISEESGPLQLEWELELLPASEGCTLQLQQNAERGNPLRRFLEGVMGSTRFAERWLFDLSELSKR